jgi:hypothetical protein
MDLHVGKRNFDLRVWRDGEKTRWDVLKGDRNTIAARSYATGSNLVTDDKTLSASSIHDEPAPLSSPSPSEALRSPTR